MSAPKLFEFPSGEVIDLRTLFRVSNLITRRLREKDQYFVNLIFEGAVTAEAILGEDREKAVAERRALIARWAQDK